MRNRAIAAAAVLICMWLHNSPAVDAQAPRPTSPAGRTPAAPARTQPPSLTQTGHARISGYVVTRDEPPKPVKRATVRARDAESRIHGTSLTDDAGYFSFSLDRAGSYYVELVDDAGHVLAVEDVGEVRITVGAGQNSTTILRVPGRLAGALWGSTAKTILGAAGAAGVGAFVAGGQPASPEQ